ncbi:hypothetical protein HDU78_003182 [Chytriomyces hyalinus]|nr:hypothetical protein HDU78_003182 [Chytriomyces hyalinus]
MDFANTHVFLTGASGGVGVETARQFLALGACVSLHANSNAEALAPLVAQYPRTGRVFKAAIDNEKDIDRVFAESTAVFGPIASLIVVHGIWPAEDVAVKDMSLARWSRTINVNLTGTFLCCRAYLRQLEAAVTAKKAPSKNVSIVFVGSTAGKFGEALHADYASSKSAMMYGLTTSLKNEVVKIHPTARVNTVSPGWIRTPMAERAMQDPALLYQALASSPLKKVSEPVDIARAILFLSSSDMAGNITGISLDVNAGMEGRLLNQPGDFGPRASKL